MAGASAENPPQSERPSTNEPPFQQTPEPKSALPALVPLPSGTSFLQAQRLDAPASTVSESTTRLIDSVFSTDIFEYTDLPLLTWFRKHTLVADGEVPFFSTPTLAKLMLKENQDLKSYVSAFQSKISSLTGIHRMSALVALTETIFTAYQPSSPTIIKLSIHFLTNTAGLSDDAFTLARKAAVGDGILVAELVQLIQQKHDKTILLPHEWRRSEVHENGRYGTPSAAKSHL